MELTKEEAIELLNERFMTMSMCADKDYCAKQNAAITMAIYALKTDFGTKEARNLINNQKAEIERLNLELQTMSPSKILLPFLSVKPVYCPTVSATTSNAHPCASIKILLLTCNKSPSTHSPLSTRLPLKVIPLIFYLLISDV